MIELVLLPAVIVTGYNRPYSLNRLLYSLSLSHYPKNSNVPLVISIDDANKNEEVLNVAKMFKWPHGHKTIIEQKENLGLKKHIFFCADLVDKFDSIILLEDDLFVSPYFYIYSQKALLFSRNEKSLAQISLYAYSVCEVSNLPFEPLDDGYDNLYIQTASSWGQAWTRNQWQEFRDWHNAWDKLSVPSVVPRNVSQWPESSWKKDFIFYMIACEKYAFFPRLSLTTNFGDKGTHFKDVSSCYQVPFQILSKDLFFCNFSDSCLKYDSFFEPIIESVHPLLPSIDSDTEFDLAGLKDIETIQKKYLISTKECSEPVRQFGNSLSPALLNIVYSIEGKEYSYGMTLNFSSKISLTRKVEIVRRAMLLSRFGIKLILITKFLDLCKRCFNK